MSLDDELCYRALRARDPRFDGLFFVGVTTTGIYCRPVCSARTPGRDRCLFYRHAAEAERAGFRACFRCRPELAPGQGRIDARSRLVTAAIAHIEEGCGEERSLDTLADELGVSARHLRRVLVQETGLSPIELLQSKRMALAKRLLHDTSLSMSEVAFASGFSSIRRFNALFRERFGMPPSGLRQKPLAGRTRDTLLLRLDYRPPLAWEALLAFLAARAIPGVESVESVKGGSYRRTVRLGKHRGWLCVTRDPERAALLAEVSSSLAEVLLPLIARLRALFDLDAQAKVVEEHLASDPLLKEHVAARPGLRIPGAFDGFETTTRAILGQQVSVRAATTLSGRVATLGESIETPYADLHRIAPGPEAMVAAGEARLAEIGMPFSRARSLVALAQAVMNEGLSLRGTRDLDETMAKLKALPGIGDWTAHYVAMRVLGAPDAFPSGDLALRKALGGLSAREAEARAEPWRPWRAYAAMHLWTSLSKGGGG